MRQALLSAALVAGLCPFPPQAGAEGSTGSVRGHVFLADGHTPAVGAQAVRIQTWTARSGGGSYSADFAGPADRAGLFTIEELELTDRGPTRVTFWVAHPSYAPRQVRVSLTPRRRTRHLTVVLRRKGGTLSGSVADDGGAPVAGATVVAFPQAALDSIGLDHFLHRIATEVMEGGQADAPTPLQRRAQTGADGRFSLSLLPAGKAVLVVRSGDRPLFIQRDVPVTEGKLTPVPVRLSAVAGPAPGTAAGAGPDRG